MPPRLTPPHAAGYVRGYYKYWGNGTDREGRARVSAEQPSDPNLPTRFDI